ncbi:hypothetical protein [Sinorhizobium meliloti]|uniref:hypothetical protein n=1 Tax=Rhizobium meliloti TaxID=382 RepID=UPI001F265BF7|nr:hypothetical protein [Sinorhizobium meliloti]
MRSELLTEDEFLREARALRIEELGNFLVETVKTSLGRKQPGIYLHQVFAGPIRHQFAPSVERVNSRPMVPGTGARRSAVELLVVLNERVCFRRWRFANGSSGSGMVAGGSGSG